MKIQTEIKYGIYLGAAMCLYTVFMWLTKLDTTYLAAGQYLDIAVIILPVTFTFLAIQAKSKETDLTIGKRILCGLIVNFISFLIHTPFSYIYHHFINPDWLKYVLDLQDKTLSAQNVEPDKIKSMLAATAASAGNELNAIIGGFVVGVIVFGIVFSLFTLPFFRSKSKLS